MRNVEAILDPAHFSLAFETHISALPFHTYIFSLAFGLAILGLRPDFIICAIFLSSVSERTLMFGRCASRF